jgi:hypothetical protein
MKRVGRMALRVGGISVVEALCAAAVAYGAAEGRANVPIVFRHCHWVLILSPAFWLYLGAVVSSVLVPLIACFSFPAFVLERHATVRNTGIGLGVLVGQMCLAHFVAWGSFPLSWDSSGGLYVRMIPFL